MKNFHYGCRAVTIFRSSLGRISHRSCLLHWELTSRESTVQATPKGTIEAVNCEAHPGQSVAARVRLPLNAAKRTLTAAEVALRRRRADVHPDDGFHRHFRAGNGNRGRGKEDWLHHAEVALFWYQRSAARMTLRKQRRLKLAVVYQTLLKVEYPLCNTRML